MDSVLPGRCRTTLHGSYSHASADDLYLARRIESVNSPLAEVRQRTFATLLVAVGVVFVGSVLPLPTGGGDPGVALAGPFGVGPDKVVHAVSYATIAGLAVLERRTRGVRNGVVGLVAVVVVVAAFGAGVEVVQSVVPGRTASGADAVANAVGAVVGVVAVLGWWLLAERD